MFRTLQTFTLGIYVESWMHSNSDASATLLLSYLEDLAETLPFRYPVTACKLDSRSELWFTFLDHEDYVMFLELVQNTWNLGGWLSDGIN